MGLINLILKKKKILLKLSIMDSGERPHSYKNPGFLPITTPYLYMSGPFIGDVCEHLRKLPSGFPLVTLKSKGKAI